MNRDEAEKFARNPANLSIVVMIALFILSFLFYFLSAFFGYLGGSGGSVTQTAIVTSSTSPDSDSSSAADSFQKIQLAMRIMPTHKSEGNMLVMVPKTGEAEWQGEYDGEFLSQVSEDYFTTDELTDYFPTMDFREETVPLGNSKPFCLHLDWSTKANKKILDKYYVIQDMPQCGLAHNPKYRWQENDPKDGIDFSLWKQHSKKVGSSSDCDSDGIFVKSKTAQGGVCYLYEVIESVCIAVTFKVDEETASYGWSYQGGCFEDGRIANYKAASPGTEYIFDKLDFEVREFTEGSGESMFSLTNILFFLSMLCLLGAIISLAFVIYKSVKGGQGQQASNSANSNAKVEM